ncbi:MAG: hypothetical protein GY862_14705 [Gammaproteobacteria bacterium]|nr:hypothetical protein [Gammaproteobacteria bacterium]
MKHFRPFHEAVLLTLFLLAHFTQTACALTFSPAAPVLAVGEEINLSVSGTSGAIIWDPSIGRIKGAGSQVTYTAPAAPGVDAVVVIDEASNVEMLVITVLAVPDADSGFSPEKANWEVFANRTHITALSISEDGETLWVGTDAGLERREAESGELIRMFTNSSGLPDNEIRALHAGADGDLWAGTGAGLAHRAVGGAWTVYDAVNSALPNKEIHALLAGENGDLWVGTRGGLGRRAADGVWTIYDTNNSGLPNNDINVLCAGDNGSLWAGTDMGLAHYGADGAWTVYNTDNSSLPYNDILSLRAGENGELWVGTYGRGLVEGGLAHRAADGAWTVYETGGNGLLSHDAAALAAGENGGLWVGTYYGGLAHRASNGAWAVYDTDNSNLPNNYVTVLHADGGGGLWLGTWNGLVRRTADGVWTIYKADNGSLPENEVRALYVDGSNGLWVGTHWSGLAHRTSDGVWTVYDISNSDLPDNYVHALAADGGGGLWIGTGNGLAHRAVDGSWTVTAADVLNNTVRALHSDADGGLWVGSMFVGLAHRTVNGAWTLYNTNNSDLPGDNIKVLETNDSGGLWAGTLDGLAYRAEDGAWTVYNTANSGLPDNRIEALYVDAGGLWAGTNEGGLAYRTSGGAWTVYNTENNGLSDNLVRSLYPDGKGGLWIGTNKNGLTHRTDEGVWTVYNTANSNLRDNSVHALHTGADGDLWIGALSGGLVHLSFNHGLCAGLDPDLVCDALRQEKQAAIFIHPRIRKHLQSYYDTTISSVYWILGKKGYTNDEIHFLSHQAERDINYDGMPDINVVDGPVTINDVARGALYRDITNADIQQAFEWAKRKGKMEQPLLVYFIGNSDKSGKNLLLYPEFEEGEMLTGQDLDALLDDYQQATGNTVVLFLETDSAGDLVSDVSGDNRVIIASAKDTYYYFERTGTFSRELFRHLRRGHTLYDAFTLAKNKLSGPEYTPLLEDTGDGYANSSREGYLARRICLGGCRNSTIRNITIDGELYNNSQYSLLEPTSYVKINFDMTLKYGRLYDTYAAIMWTPPDDGESQWFFMTPDSETPFTPFSRDFEGPFPPYQTAVSENANITVYEGPLIDMLGRYDFYVGHVRTETDITREVLFNAIPETLEVMDFLTDKPTGCIRRGIIVDSVPQEEQHVLIDYGRYVEICLPLSIPADKQHYNTYGVVLWSSSPDDEPEWFFRTSDPETPFVPFDVDSGAPYPPYQTGISGENANNMGVNIFEAGAFNASGHFEIYTGYAPTGTNMSRAALLSASPYILEVAIPEEPDNSPCTGSACDIPLPEKGAAIIIHPRASRGSLVLRNSIENLVSYTYMALNRRQYNDDEIYLLSYLAEIDVNRDGVPEANIVDAPETLLSLASGAYYRDITRADVQQAFNWAKHKGKTEQPLLVYAVGLASDNDVAGLYLNPFESEMLSGGELGAMLTDYQQATGNAVTVILDVHHSGTLIKDLSGDNRVIITSSDEEGSPTHLGKNNGLDSFTYLYFKQLRLGYSFYEAFDIVTAGGSRGFSFDDQHPLLEDDGDGFVTSRDGRFSRTICLGGCSDSVSP